MNDAPLPCVEVDPPGETTCSVVWLHGLGADGHDFEPIVPELGIDPDLGVRFVFPHAPAIAVTINGGMVMPAWYDIRDADLDRRADDEGVLRSAQQVEALLSRERQRGIPSERIVLAGFSQGGAVAVHTALRHSERLAGILGLSCYLLRAHSLEEELHSANRSTPIFMSHGEHDPMVPVHGGALLRDRLQQLGYHVEWVTYPMMHQVCMEQIQAIGHWLQKVLA